MSQNLLKLHILAAEAQIHHAQYSGGVLSVEEFQSRAKTLINHTDIVTESEHAERDKACRDIINSTITLANLSK